MRRRFLLLAGAAGLFVFAAVAQAQQRPQPPARFGFGRPATPAEISALDIDVGPDGKGLPAGRGTAADGGVTYAAKCAVCHGKTGTEGPNDVLVGPGPGGVFPSGKETEVRRTIGNYWPYATTVFDYIRRAMPTPAPGSLTDDEVYGLVAFLLAANAIIPDDAVMDATTLPKVAMPARDKFVIDPRGGPKARPGPPPGR
jgi:mono/diheme cytochrome c family protein